MSSYDKFCIMDKLKEQGWKETQLWQLEPPQELWDNRHKTFDVYEAEWLQELLGGNKGELDHDGISRELAR